MTQLFAQPYDITASGFYFDSVDEFNSKSCLLINDYGQPVEEFEIQFIDGEGIDGELFSALSINQCTLDGYFNAIEEWSDEDKIKVIIAVGEAGYNFDLSKDSPDQFDVDTYKDVSLRDLAMQFVEEGLFGHIPENVQSYLDYDAIARDLGMDYGQVTIDGISYLYRCA